MSATRWWAGELGGVSLLARILAHLCCLVAGKIELPRKEAYSPLLPSSRQERQQGKLNLVARRSSGSWGRASWDAAWWSCTPVILCLSPCPYCTPHTTPVMGSDIKTLG